MAKKKVFKFLDSNGKTSHQLNSIFQNDLNLTKYASLLRYLEKESFTFDSHDLSLVIKNIEKVIARSIEKASFLLFHYYTHSGDWGDKGEQQVKFSFCRFLLKVPLNESISSEHLDQFQDLIISKNKQFGINTLTAEEANTEYYSFLIPFLNLSISSTKAKKVNDLLVFIGSKCRLVGVKYGYETLFIFYKGTQKTIFNQQVSVIKQELQRSPNVIIPLAAFNGGRDVYLREESMRTIFYQKWSYFFDGDPSDKEFIRYVPERNISEGIKALCLDYYELKTKETLLLAEKDVVRDLIETVMYHELGHVVVQNDILPVKTGSFCEGTKSFGETIFMALTEVLADFAPNYNDLKGPLQNMVAISKKDIKRASRMFYMYFSDVWFYDTDDEHMFLYSDIMILSLLRYVKKDLTVDFEKLEYDIYFNSKKDEANKDNKRFLNQLFGFTVQSVRKLEGVIQTLSIPLGDKDVTYDYFKGVMMSSFEQENKTLDVNSYNFHTKYWTIMMKYLIKLSPDLERIRRTISQLEHNVLKRLFVLSAGKETVDSYNNDHRKYIFEHCESIGLCFHKDNLTL
jgi:hypothetical protein